MKETINKIKKKINKLKYKVRYKLILNRELSFYLYIISCHITLLYKYVVMWGEPLVIGTYLLDGGMQTIRILMSIVSLVCMLYVIRHLTPMVGWYGVIFRVIFSVWKIFFWVPVIPPDGVLDISLQGLLVLTCDRSGGVAGKVDSLPEGNDNYLEAFRDFIGGV